MPINTSLQDLLETVKSATDPWLLFLYVFRNLVVRSNLLMIGRKALFLSRLSRREEAIESALLSILGFPWNWSVWSLLGSSIGDGEEVTRSLKKHSTFLT